MIVKEVMTGDVSPVAMFLHTVCILQTVHIFTQHVFTHILRYFEGGVSFSKVYVKVGSGDVPPTALLRTSAQRASTRRFSLHERHTKK